MKKSAKKRLRAGACIFALALIVRLAYLLESSDAPTFTVPIVDSFVYSHSAAALAQGEGFNSAFFFQPFFYPFCLGMVYWAGGSSILAAKLLQLLLGCLVCVLTYRLGKQVFSKGVGITAGLITALYGPLIFFETELLATGMASFWMVVLVWLLLRVTERGRKHTYFLLGLTGALSILTRPTFGPLFILGMLWLVIKNRRSAKLRKNLALGFALLVLGFILPSLSVALLNRHVTGHFEFLPASGGLNLYLGNNANYAETVNARLGSQWSDVIDLPKRQGVRGDMWDQQRFYYDQVGRYLIEEPVSFATGLGRKGLQFVSSRETPRNVDIYLFRQWSTILQILVWKLGAFGFPFGLLLPLAAVGIFLYRKKISFPLLLGLLAYSLAIVLVFVTARYRAPVVPLIAILAGAGIVGLFQTGSEQRWGRFAAAVGILIAAALLSTLPGPFQAEKMDYEPELYCSLGDALYRTGQIEEAEVYFNRAIVLKDDYVDAHVNAATIYLLQGRTGDAVKAYRKSLELKPDLAQAHCNLGALLTDQKEYDAAIEHCLEGLKIRPHEEAFRFNLARIYAEQGRTEEMKESLRQVLELDPSHGPSLFRLARRLEQEGRIREAVKHYEKAAESLHDADCFNRLGSLYFKMGEIDLAAARFEAGLKLKPDDAGLLYNLSKALDRQGLLDEAIALLQKALKIDPDFTQGYFDLGSMLVRANRYLEALKPLSRAVAAAPGDPVMRHTLAVALYKSGRCQEAAKEYYEVLRGRQDFVPSLSGLAWLRATHPDPSLRNAQEAVILAERAAKIDNGNPNVLNTLAAAYAEARRYQEALAAADRAIALAEQSGLADLAENIRSRAQFYRQGKPFRETMGD